MATYLRDGTLVHEPTVIKRLDQSRVIIWDGEEPTDNELVLMSVELFKQCVDTLNGKTQ